MSMMRARVRGHRWVDHPVEAVMKARVPGQWVDCPAAVVMEAREQGRCWIDHPAVAVMEARVQGRHWVDRPSVGADSDILCSVSPDYTLDLVLSRAESNILSSVSPDYTLDLYGHFCIVSQLNISSRHALLCTVRPGTLLLWI
ncbi:hypothetical protein ACOMHN_045275 [Nucella lapillus]